jgi:hypothetical protein
MDNTPEQLEALWNNLLSRKPAQVRVAYDSLDIPSRKIVLAHLEHMAHDPGWQPGQRSSAKAALKILKNYLKQEE